MRVISSRALFAVIVAASIARVAAAQDQEKKQDAPAASPTPTPSPTPSATPSPTPIPIPSPTPSPRPDKPEERPRPADATVVVAPEELTRVRAELERIEAERKKLAGDQAALERRQRELEAASRGLSTSPVLRARTKVHPITLRETIVRALAENADLLVDYLASQEPHEQIDVERGVFDPVLRETFGGYARTRVPNFSNNPFTGLPQGELVAFDQRSWSFATRLEERLPTGTNLAIEYDDGWAANNNVFALNPTFNPKVKVEASQNLLRGFGLDANLAPMRAAEADAGAADQRYVSRLMDVVLQVESAYWDLVRQEEALRTNESALRSAMELLYDQRTRKKLGAATGLDVTIAEAGVAQRREGVIVAENQLETARDALIRIVEPPGEPSRYDLFVVPVDRPDLVEEVETDLDRATATALARRPDYKQTELELEAARQRAVAADNGALPQVDLVGTFEEDGLGNSWDRAWRSFGPFWSWTAGVRVNLPIFLRSERATARRAHLEVDRVEAALRALEAQIQLDVRKAVRDLRTARARIEAARVAVQLSEKQVEAAREEVRFGVSIPRQVLDFLVDLANSRSHLVQAHIDYRLALTTLAKAEGTLLDPFTNDLPPRAKLVMGPRQP